jgi:putative sporulation protein YtaF
MSFAHLLTALLLALASNLDNVGVGIAYGMRRVRVPLGSNLLIAAITATGTLVSVLFGNTVGKFLSHGLASVLAGAVLISMGAWVVVREALALYQNSHQAPDQAPTGVSEAGYLSQIHSIRINPLSADSDRSGKIDFREATLLGLALTPNNLVNGAAAGMMNLSVAVLVLMVFVFSVITIWAGIGVGQLCGKRWLGSIAGVASGALLIFVGTCEMVI